MCMLEHLKVMILNYANFICSEIIKSNAFTLKKQPLDVDFPG